MPLVRRPKRIKTGKNSYVTIGKTGVSSTFKSGRTTVTTGPKGTKVTTRIAKGLSWVNRTKKK